MAKKTAVAKPEEESTPSVDPLQIAETWNEWKDLEIWESATPSIKKDEYKARILKYFKDVLGNIKTKYPDRSPLTKDEVFVILEECKRVVYQTDYVPLAKPISLGRSEKIFFFNLNSTPYYDWAKSRYEEITTRYTGASRAEQEKMVNDGEIKIDRDKAGKITAVKPRMLWGKRRVDVPQHSYMASAWGIAMPVEAFKEAKGNQDSPLWEKMMPTEISLNSDSQNDIHFGDKTSDRYIAFEPMKAYEINCIEERGPKIKTPDDKSFYLYEGTVEELKLTNDKGEEVKTSAYSGQRSYMYNLKPTASPECKETNEFRFEGMTQEESNEYMIELAYNTWFAVIEASDKELSGMAQIPTFFSKMSIKRDKKKDRLDALHPVAFEADVLDVNQFKDEENADAVPFYRFRLDDQLDTKMQKIEKIDEKDKFAEITLSLLGNDILLEMAKKLAVRSRIKVIATLSRKSNTDPIEGRCVWFKPVVKFEITGMPKEIFNTSDYALDKEEEENIEGKDYD
jgi:hypothetical protein